MESGSDIKYLVTLYISLLTNMQSGMLVNDFTVGGQLCVLKSLYDSKAERLVTRTEREK